MAETPGQHMAGMPGQPAAFPMHPEQSIRYTLDLTKQYHNLLHLGDTQSGKAQTFYWDGNVVSMNEEGEESFYLQDDLGSSMELLNAEGGIRESYAFDEFGVPFTLNPYSYCWNKPMEQVEFYLQ